MRTLKHNPYSLFRICTGLLILIVAIFTLSGCNKITELNVKKSIYDRYKNAKGFSATVALSAQDNPLMSAQVTLNGEDYTFKIISPEMLKDIAFEKQGNSSFVTYKDLKLETANIPRGISPLISITPLLKIDPDSVMDAKVEASERGYSVIYKDDTKNAVLDFEKETLSLIRAEIELEDITYTAEFTDFKILE